MSLSAAKTRVMFAREYLFNRVDDVEPTLRAAEEFLAAVDDDEKAPVVAEIAEIRAELENTPTSEESRMMSGAKGKISQARFQMEHNYGRSDVEETLDAALPYLDGVRERFHGPILAELEEARRQLGGAEPEPAPDAVGVATVTVPPGQPHPHVSQANTRVVQARSAVEGGYAEGVEEVLQQALDLLAPVPDDQKAELLTQIDQLRVEAEAVVKAEAIRRVESGLDIELSGVSSTMDYNFQESRRSLARFHERFSREDVARVLPEAAIERYRARAAELATKLDAVVKADALDRAGSKLRELEERLETDPLAGLTQDAAYQVTSQLRYLREGVLEQLGKLPEDDPDAVAVRDRLAATDRRLDEASAAWGSAALHAEVTGHWAGVRQGIDGWQAESVDAARATLYAPSLPGTHAAARQLRYFLRDSAATRAEHPADEVLRAVYREADELYDEATAKLNTGFERILDLAEAMPTPMQSADHQQTMHLDSAAQTMLEDTPYLEPTRNRIEALADRWKREYDEVIEARKALYQQLSVEADTAWPEIVASSGATADFDPSDHGVRGSTVLLTDVYNRCGWEWSGREYGFAAKHRGVVLAGVYEPHVMKALEHAWYELKLDVGDRITWDVIAVVEGPGQIGERTVRTVRSADTGAEIGKIEEWPVIDCLRLRVVGLHAGPVAVGP